MYALAHNSYKYLQGGNRNKGSKVGITGRTGWHEHHQEQQQGNNKLFLTRLTNYDEEYELKKR